MTKWKGFGGKLPWLNWHPILAFTWRN